MASAFSKEVRIYKLISDNISGKDFNKSKNNLLIDNRIEDLFENHNILR